jgi:hypothetical protein
MVYILAAIGAVLLFETWCLWRVLDRLYAVGRVEDRLSSVAHSLALLTDTTETCFQIVASRLDDGPAREAVPPGRGMRQRRVVGAARHGKTVAEIAAEEEVAEAEVRLRLHLAQQDERKGQVANGSMRTA